MRYGWLVLSAVLAAGLAGETAAQTTREYQVKAAYMYKFAKYVRWPREAERRTNPVFRIGVLGKDPFGNFHTIEGKKIGGCRLVVKRSRRLKDLLDCLILFVSTSEKERLKTLLPVVEKKHILTIGESKRFAERGGIIQLFRKGKKIRFAINLDAARRAGLRLDAKLLKLARIVREPRKKRAG